jgi:hypothetical protein
MGKMKDVAIHHFLENTLEPKIRKERRDNMLFNGHKVDQNLMDSVINAIEERKDYLENRIGFLNALGNHRDEQETDKLKRYEYELLNLEDFLRFRVKEIPNVPL